MRCGWWCRTMSAGAAHVGIQKSRFSKDPAFAQTQTVLRCSVRPLPFPVSGVLRMVQYVVHKAHRTM